MFHPSNSQVFPHCLFLVLRVSVFKQSDLLFHQTASLIFALSIEVYCQPPREVDQGYVVAVQKTEYEVGFDIHYLCKKNFLLDGPQKVTCLPNGSWSASPPHCRGGRNIIQTI